VVFTGGALSSTTTSAPLVKVARRPVALCVTPSVTSCEPRGGKKRLVKGSAAAKRYMAKIRRMRKR